MPIRATMILLILAVTASLAAKPVKADGTCFTSTEADADALLRYDARQRAVGLLCHSTDEKNLFKDYQLFTASNASAIANASELMGRWYGSEAAAHDAETEMQNAEAFLAASQGNRAYCRKFAPGLYEAELESPVELKREVARFRLVEPSAVKPCR